MTDGHPQWSWPMIPASDRDWWSWPVSFPSYRWRFPAVSYKVFVNGPTCTHGIKICLVGMSPDYFTTTARITTCLAADAFVALMKRAVGTSYNFYKVQYDDDFIVLELDNKFGVILDLPRLERYEPSISYKCWSLKIYAACLPNGYLMASKKSKKWGHRTYA